MLSIFKTKTVKILACALLLISCAAYAAPQGVYAAPQPVKCDKSTGLNCEDSAAKAAGKSCDQNASCKKIYDYLIKAADLLSALVGVVAVGMIIFGGIEFSSSGGDPQKVASAKGHITNAVIALVAFLFLFAFLNFIIPGGLFNG
jgi:hypothetical protein